MSIIIAGYGFVGKAHETFFKNHYDLQVVDPKYKHVGLQHLDPEAVIICVDTPELENGECDISNVIDVLSNTKPTTPVLIITNILLLFHLNFLELTQQLKTFALQKMF